MENLNLGDSTTIVTSSSPIQDVPLEVDSISLSQMHEIPKTDINSSDHSLYNHEERENKRTWPWRDTRSNYNDHNFPRTYHRDNSTERYNGRCPISRNYPNEGRIQQIRRSQDPIYNRYSQPRTYHRYDINNSPQPYGYFGHRYHDWNAYSQHHGRNYSERENNLTNSENRRFSYDRQRQPWSNSNQRQPWANNGENLSHRWLPYERKNYNLQNGAGQYRFPERENSNHPPSVTSYSPQKGVRQYRFPMREDSRVYCGNKNIADSGEVTGVGFNMPRAKNNQGENMWAMWPVPCERNILLREMEMRSEKVEHEGEQEIEIERERSSVHEEKTIFRVPNGLFRKKLLILDVNGLLADVIFPPPKEDIADINIYRRAIFKRPFVNDFLKFCFERFDVAIWSSRTKKILDGVVDYLLGDMRCKLRFCWNQSHCTKTGVKTLENQHKEMLLKEIKKVWEKQEDDISWEKGYYNESNTLLLDDSPYKALLNPMHTAIFPHTYSYKDTGDNSLGAGGDLRAYLTGLLTAENVKIYVEKHPFGQRPIDETNSSWEYYYNVITSQTLVQPQI